MNAQSEPCGYCGRIEAEEPREQCLEGCEIDFHCDLAADAHARLTGHLCGWEIVPVGPTESEA